MESIMNFIGSTVGMVLSLAVYVVLVIGYWKMFVKAGEAGWKSIIPILNIYVMFKIAYGKGWKFLLLLVPILNVVLEIACCIRLAHAYGKGTGFGILTVFFLPIAVCILGFGDAEYEGPTDKFL